MGKANCRRTAISSAKPYSQASQWLATGTRNTGVEDILSNTYSETPIEQMMMHTAEDLLRYTSAHSISTA